MHALRPQCVAPGLHNFRHRPGSHLFDMITSVTRGLPTYISAVIVFLRLRSLVCSARNRVPLDEAVISPMENQWCTDDLRRDQRQHRSPLVSPERPGTGDWAEHGANATPTLHRRHRRFTGSERSLGVAQNALRCAMFVGVDEGRPSISREESRCNDVCQARMNNAILGYAG